MRLSVPKCPTCGEPPIGELDTIEAIAEFGDVGEGGEVEWSGDTDVLWDTQRPQKMRGMPLLICNDGHTWPSEIEDED